MSQDMSTGGHRQFRYTRSIALPSAIALAVSVSVGAGVFVLMGQIVRFSDPLAAVGAYLLALFATVPIILTTVERVAFLPIRNGVYGLSRESSFLSIPYFTGWTMVGGLACLAALFGWGVAVYTKLLLTMFTATELPQTQSLATAITVVGVGLALLWERARWQRYTVLILGGIAFIAILIGRGLWILDPSMNPSSSISVDLLDVTVMVAASFWAIHFVLSIRNEMHRPTRNLLRALLAGDVIRTVIGMAAGLALMWYPGIPLTTDAPLNDIAALRLLGDSALWQLFYNMLGLIFCVFALRQTVEQATALLSRLREDGFIPEDSVFTALGTRMDLAKIIYWGLAVAGVAFIEIGPLAELSAAGFLLAVSLSVAPALRSSENNLPQNRNLKLPFHPLFPGLTVTVGLLLTALTLDTVGVYWIAWNALGGALYALYARAHALAARRETVVVEADSDAGTAASAADEVGARVMVWVDTREDVANMMRLAALLVPEQGGEVLVLKVLTVPSYVSDTMERRLAQEELDALERLVEEAEADIGAGEGVRISPMVRLSSASTFGVLDTAAEEKPSLLVAAWRGEVSEERRTPDLVLNDLVRYASCPVAILRGEMPDKLERMVLFTAGGPNAADAVPAVERLAAALDTQVALVTVNCDMEADEAQKYLDQTLALASDADRFEPRLVDAGSVAAGVATTSENADLVIFGFSKEDVSDRTFFGGAAADFANQLETPSLLMRGRQEAHYLGVRRLTDSLRDALPNLTEQERGQVAQNMREGAIPSVDFFVLITLAAAIATLGLLQSSTAVIIGAMLVAPLMSPILAMGMAIVLGESYTLRIAIEATAKGIAVAILVGILMTIISPFDEPTPEILARTAPTVLDMMVALVSGAAAGYAVCRKQVAAALPGVAIAAALVPPLCVVGYGIGTSQFDIATGSLLLFTTNLVAIVVAGAFVFLALGFHPPRSEREEFRRNLWVTGMSLGIVFVVLMIATILTLRDANARLAVEQVLRQEMVTRAALVDSLDVKRRAGEYYVTATVFVYSDAPLSSEEVNSLQEDLSAAVGGPVSMNLTFVPASGSDLTGAANLMALREYFEAAATDADVVIAELRTSAREEGVELVAALLTYPESQLDQRLLDEWQSDMTEIAGRPVFLDVTTVQGQRASSAPTATPEP